MLSWSYRETSPERNLDIQFTVLSYTHAHAHRHTHTHIYTHICNLGCNLAHSSTRGLAVLTCQSESRMNVISLGTNSRAVSVITPWSNHRSLFQKNCLAADVHAVPSGTVEAMACVYLYGCMCVSVRAHCTHSGVLTPLCGRTKSSLILSLFHFFLLLSPSVLTNLN